MINFNRKFLHGVACALVPLMDTLKGSGKSLTWSPVLESAFARAKDLLSSVPELVHPRPNALVSLAVDAFDTHLGAVHQQLLNGSWTP